MKSDDEELKDKNFTAIDGSPQRRFKKQHISLKSETEESLSKENWLCIFLGVNFLKVEDKYEVALRRRIDLNKHPIDVGSIDFDWTKEILCSPVHQLIAKSLNGNHFSREFKEKRNNGGL
ncbi:hypothetical protein Leryth_026785 [Lithospermum erythrorhizon]|nr:hypothetical protein Leryth_026785 [Lithospermum erythrorhizon]